MLANIVGLEVIWVTSKLTLVAALHSPRVLYVTVLAYGGEGNEHAVLSAT